MFDGISDLFKKSFKSSDCYSLGILILKLIFSNEYDERFNKLFDLSLKMINGNPLDRISIYDATIQFINDYVDERYKHDEIKIVDELNKPIIF